MDLDSIASGLVGFVMQYKWWLIACSPIVIVLIVLKMMNPR